MIKITTETDVRDKVSGNRKTKYEIISETRGFGGLEIRSVCTFGMWKATPDSQNFIDDAIAALKILPQNNIGQSETQNIASLQKQGM